MSSHNSLEQLWPTLYAHERLKWNIFLWVCIPLEQSGSLWLIQDHSDHGVWMESTNPCPEWILQFLWVTMVWVTLNYRSSSGLFLSSPPCDLCWDWLVMYTYSSYYVSVFLQKVPTVTGISNHSLHWFFLRFQNNRRNASYVWTIRVTVFWFHAVIWVSAWPVLKNYNKPRKTAQYADKKLLNFIKYLRLKVTTRWTILLDI